ncbi:MAG: NAD(P) transhydrogenase subunit alpha [Oscillospiraceae bacterium]|nr:NAD(P) transhydrogenase subunit alpha [Oscillospiraceae bacterium]
MPGWLLILIFAAAAVVGYFIINKVPTLLHTPLMSGMNALSGITVLGGLTVLAAALRENAPAISAAVGVAAVAFAMVNVVGGFAVTGRMLKMFKKKEDN